MPRYKVEFEAEKPIEYCCECPLSEFSWFPQVCKFSSDSLPPGAFRLEKCPLKEVRSLYTQ